MALFKARTNVRSLAELAKEIGKRWSEADQHNGRAEHARIEAGRLLIEAREQVDAAHRAHGSRSMWAAWCEVHVPGRSLRDIRRVMKMAGAADPAAAHEAEKAANRASKQRTSDVRSTTASTLTQASAAKDPTVSSAAPAAGPGEASASAQGTQAGPTLVPQDTRSAAGLALDAMAIIQGMSAEEFAEFDVTYQEHRAERLAAASEAEADKKTA